MNELLTIKEVMGILKVSRATVLRHISAKRLPAHHVGRLIRIRATDLDRLIEDKPATQNP